MAIFINNVPANVLDDLYNSLHKYVVQYLTSGRIKSLFSFFETEEMRYGVGFEVNIVYAATGSDTKLAEHAEHKANIISVIVNAPYKKHYGVTIDEEKLLQCVGNDAKLREYAGELVESLMQGEIEDKNTAIYAEIDKLKTVPLNVTVGTTALDEEKIASAFIRAMKAKTSDFYEGVEGTYYGNTYAPAGKRLAAEKIAIIMNSDLASLLDTYGYSKAFDAKYLELYNIERIVTARAPENTVFITDGRNIQVKNTYQSDVTIPNSDGSRNEFHNIKYQIAGLFDGNGVPVFPACRLTLTEA